MTSKDVPRRPGLAWPILVGGAMIYGLLCLPAIGQRGYPPIDPFWIGVTYLWVSPIAFSAFFDSMRFRSRRIQLSIYLLFTAFIESATEHISTPRMVSLEGMLVSTFLFYGPGHAIIGLIVEGMMQLCLRPVRMLVDVPVEAVGGLPRISLSSWIILHTLICATIGLPLAYRTMVFRTIRARAIASADEDWAEGDAVIYKDRNELGAVRMLDYEIDPETGLGIDYRVDYRGFRAIYNRRIAELIAQRGLPKWSLKRFIPTEAAMLTMFDSTEMVEVSSFPYDVNSSIVLMRRGTINLWGSTITNGYDDLSIATERSGLVDTVSGVAPVHVKVDGEVIYVRNGSEWVGAFHQSGVFLGSTSRP